MKSYSRALLKQRKLEVQAAKLLPGIYGSPNLEQCRWVPEVTEMGPVAPILLMDRAGQTNRGVTGCHQTAAVEPETVVVEEKQTFLLERLSPYSRDWSWRTGDHRVLGQITGATNTLQKSAWGNLKELAHEQFPG